MQLSPLWLLYAFVWSTPTRRRKINPHFVQREFERPAARIQRGALRMQKPKNSQFCNYIAISNKCRRCQVI
jgi:hypothetical protein